jgi:voltage-gated potassium channel
MTNPPPPEVEPPSSTWSRPFLTLVGMLIAYYAYPVELSETAPVIVVVSLAGTVGGLLLVGAIMVKELGYVRHGGPGRGPRLLAMLLVLLVMASSLTFFLLNQTAPDQISGLETRTDALYFTLSTMTTVGYGDVHAQGQLARALVCVLLVFNVVVVASLIRLYTTGRDRGGKARD